MVPKTNLEACNCVVRYNAHVDRRIMGCGMVQDIPTARQKTGFKDSNRGLLLLTWFISVLMSLSRSMEVTSKLFPLPKVPLGIEIVAWQLHSDDLYPLVHPLRAKCTRCFTMPVIATELEYREYRSGFFWGGFFPLSTISPRWKADSLWTPRKKQTRGQNLVELCCGMDFWPTVRWTWSC